jgi:hypothetical protein
MDQMKARPTLAEASAWVRANATKPGGVRCPCCHLPAKVYHRPIDHEMVRTLAAIFRVGGTDQFVHQGRDLEDRVRLRYPKLDSHEVSQLGWWGLVEEKPGSTRRDGGRGGFWRCTQKGINWLDQIIDVPKWAYTYGGKLLEIDGPPVFASEALGKAFDLDELMGDE